MKLFLSALLCVALCGCAYNCAKLYDPATGNLVAKSRTYTLWDATSDLAKLRITSLAVTNQSGAWSPGISISALAQQSTSSNITDQISAVAAGVAAGLLKGLKP
jgi:hypothetical protein